MTSLLDLPLEIRLQIYSYLLITRDHNKLEPLGGAPRLFQGIPILRTCKQVNAEATPVLYGRNLLLADIRKLTKQARLPWVLSKPFWEPRLLAMVRRWWLTVILDSLDSFYGPQDVSAAFTNMDELVLEFMYGLPTLGAPEKRRATLRPFEAVRGVKTVRVVSCPAEIQAYVDWLKKAMMTPAGGEVQPYSEVAEVLD